MDIRKLLKAALTEHINDHKDAKVEKTFPMKKEWAKEWTDIQAEADKMEKATAKLKNRKKKLWIDIEFALDLHDKHLRINEKENEIEQMEDIHDHDED